jgi:alpha-2-macroglobulin
MYGRTRSEEGILMRTIDSMKTWGSFLVVASLMILHGMDAAAVDQNEGEAAREPLRPIGVFPLPGEIMEDWLVFYFDEDLQWPPEGGNAKESPLTIDPPMKGEMGVKGNRVFFHLNAGEKPGDGPFLVQLSPALTSVSGRKIASDALQNAVARRTFGVNAPRYLRMTEEHHVLGLPFSLHTLRKEVQTALTVTDAAGVRVDFKLGGADVGKEFELSLPLEAVWPVKMRIDAALQDRLHSGTLAVEQTFSFPRDTNLRVHSIRWKTERGNSQKITLELSHPVASAVLQRFLHVRVDGMEEEISTSAYERGRTQQEIRFQAKLAVDATLEVRLDLGLISKEGHGFQAPYSASVARSYDGLTISRPRWQNGGVAGPYLQFYFNGRVAINDIRSHLSVDPAVEEMKIQNPYSGTVQIFGKWQRGKTYQLRLGEALENQDGRYRLARNYSRTLDKLPDWSSIDFGNKGSIYYPQQHAGKLLIEARNLDQAEATLHQVFPSSIPLMLKYLRDDGRLNNYQSVEFSKELATREFSFSEGAEETRQAVLDLKELAPEGARGLFFVSLNPSPQRRDAQLVVWTDLGVLAHWQNDEVLVYVHDLHTLQPLSMAKVSLYSSKYQTMAQAVSNASGVVRFSNLDTDLGMPFAVVVETRDDATFLKLAPRTEDAVGFSTALHPYMSAPYEAFVHADRNLYRPGETIHARAIVRTAEGAAANAPLLIRLLNPQGKEVFSKPILLSETGSGGIDIETKTTHRTGKYRLLVSAPGSQGVLGETPLHIEEFVPNRMKATVELDEAPWIAGKTYGARVLAEHLSGGAAEKRKASAQVLLQKHEFTHPDWPGFRFGNDADFQDTVIQLGEQKTDSQGKAAFTFNAALKETKPFALRAYVRGEVHELGGRTVADVAERTLFPADIVLGLSLGEAPSGEAVEARVVAMDPLGKPAALASVQVSLERESWHYYVRRFSHGRESRWERSYNTIETLEVALVDGQGKAQFDLPAYGHFRVRVHSEKTPFYSTRSFDRWWSSLRIRDDARPSLIQLQLNQDDFVLGEEAVVHIESPFDGMAVAVLQGPNLHSIHNAEVRDGVGEIRFKVTKQHLPNTWVEVTVMHNPKDIQAGSNPYASFAMINLKARDPRRSLAVSLLDVPEEMRPGQPLTFRCETKNFAGYPVAAEVTIAAVDEGIHGILGYDNPDPVGWFNRTRRPDFRRAHYYDRVAYDFDPAKFGGGALAKRLGRGTSEVDDNWIKPVALWTGVVHTNSRGIAEISLDVPEFTGKLRLVAVAATPTATGASAGNIFVRRPFMLRTTMPRFALPGDAFQCRAVLRNTTDAPAKARISWRAEGSLSERSGTRDLDLPAQGEATLQADFDASTKVGAGTIYWRMDVFDEAGKSLESVEKIAALPVRTPAAYQSDHLFARLLPGESRSFKNTKFVDDAQVEFDFAVSPHAVSRLEEALGNVIRYPYGCVEQTTSKCMPLYVLRQWVKSGGSSQVTAEELEDYLRAGMERLFSMQTPSGGLSTWPGGARSPYAYGSVYACHFLTMIAKDRALAVPDQDFKHLQAYVRTVAEDASSTESHHLYLRAYALYVLSLGGDGWALEQIGRFDKLTLPTSARYLLASALAMNGKAMTDIQQYLADAPSAPLRGRMTRGVLNSPIRNTAVELLAWVAMNPTNEEAHQRAQVLLTHLEQRYYRNTQDTAFIVTALGAYFEKNPHEAGQVAALILKGEEQWKLDPAEPFQRKHEGAGIVYEVRNTGERSLYVNLATAGMPLTPNTAAVTSKMALERRIYDDNGKTITDSAFHHGRTYIVEWKLRCDNTSDNVVVADLLPAGFEIENTRLDAPPMVGTKANKATPATHSEIRDDRFVAVFDKLRSGDHYFYYTVRAVTPGKFQYPQARAECMYDGEIHAATQAGTVEVR